MRPRIRHAVGAGALALPPVLVFGLGVTPAAAATQVALYHMNEPAGATTMVDSVGGHNGTLTHVQTGVPGVSGNAYRFDGSTSVASIPASAAFNPGNADVSFTVHLNFTTVPSRAVGDYDILRGPTQGAYKMEVVARKHRTIALPLCFFKGSRTRATLAKGRNLADGRWHTVQCTKTATAITLTVDGTKYTKSATVGTLTNTGALSLGAKSYKGGGDWYKGMMDEVSLSIG
jgi:hypothetical protein